MLTIVAVLLAAAVVTVSLSRRAELGSKAHQGTLRSSALTRPARDGRPEGSGR